MIGRITETELPQVLYKFRDWKNKYHRRLISKQEIYFPKPSEFNDPFDGNIPIRWDLLSFEDCVKKNMELVAITHKNADPKLLREYAIKVTKEKTFWHPDMLAKERPEELEKWNSIIGLLSLSSAPDNILMWSHYSMNHTGFVVGLGTESLMHDYDFDYLEPINYKIDYPLISGNDNTDERFKKKFFSKSELWAYEQEWRVSKNHIKHRLVRLRKDTIKEVAIGCRTSDSDTNKIIKLVRNHLEKSVQIFKMEMEESVFGLTMKQLD